MSLSRENNWSFSCSVTLHSLVFIFKFFSLNQALSHKPQPSPIVSRVSQVYNRHLFLILALNSYNFTRFLFIFVHFHVFSLSLLLLTYNLSLISTLHIIADSTSSTKHKNKQHSSHFSVTLWFLICLLIFSLNPFLSCYPHQFIFFPTHSFQTQLF